MGKRNGARADTSNFNRLLDNVQNTEAEEIVRVILPFAAQRALMAEEVFKNEQLPILMSGFGSRIALSRDQISVLLSLMLFGLVSEQDSTILPKVPDFTLM